MKQNVAMESDLHWELFDDTNRKQHSLKQTLFFLVCFMMAGFGLYQLVKETNPPVAVNHAQELSVGSVADFEPEYKVAARDVPHCESEWDELNVVDNSNSDVVKDILEHDVFEKFDKNGDGELDANEMQAVVESGVWQSMADMSVADMKMIANGLKNYPVLHITDDMSDDEIDEACLMILSMEGKDLGKEFQKQFGDDPKAFMNGVTLELDDLLADASENVHMKFDDFKHIVEDPITEIPETTKDLVIPAQCETRRRLFVITGTIGAIKLGYYAYSYYNYYRHGKGVYNHGVVGHVNNEVNRAKNTYNTVKTYVSKPATAAKAVQKTAKKVVNKVKNFFSGWGRR